jgi:hypothetical protein
MIIGHLPAGYILTKKLQTLYGYNKYIWVGLLASILPDFDVINFYLDKYEIPHHDYWPHQPFYWFVTGLLVLTVIYMLKKDKYKIMSDSYWRGKMVLSFFR